MSPCLRAIGLPPLFDAKSEILILGSFPGAKSRKTGEYYADPSNRFWEVIGSVFKCPALKSYPYKPDKENWLKAHHIALWDVIEACCIIGSKDSDIKNENANCICSLLSQCHIKKIYCVGRKAERLYKKYVQPYTKHSADRLPSTSKLNTRFSTDKLITEWTKISKTPSTARLLCSPCEIKKEPSAFTPAIY